MIRWPQTETQNRKSFLWVAKAGADLMRLRAGCASLQTCSIPLVLPTSPLSMILNTHAPRIAGLHSDLLGFWANENRQPILRARGFGTISVL